MKKGIAYFVLLKVASTRQNKNKTSYKQYTTEYTKFKSKLNASKKFLLMLADYKKS